MSKGLNKVMLIGFLGRDPEVKETKSGDKMTKISIATTESWTDSTGVKQERTEWHLVVFFKRVAEIAAQYLHKGSKVYVEGKMQTQKWVGDDGKYRFATQIVANDLQMLSGKREEGDENDQRGGYEEDDQNAEIPF